MSNDRRPAKVKLYSGSGALPGQAEHAGKRRGDTAPATASSAALALAAGQESANADGSGGLWLVLLLFILGCALGGGLFTAFLPL